MKNLINVLTIALLFCVASLNMMAQEKDKLDKMPMPIGGIEALSKNVVYPLEAKKNKIQGKVFVTAIVNEKGSVIKATITKSDDETLNEAAVNAVKATKFTPGEKDGKKIQAEIVVPILFKLS